MSLSILECIIFLKSYTIKFLKKRIIKRKPITEERKVGIRIEILDPKIKNEKINPIRRVSLLMSISRQMQ